MTPENVLDYFTHDGKRRGAQSRFARAVNITPQYASTIINSGAIPFGIQCELQVRTKGQLKVDPELINDSDSVCEQCGKELKGSCNATN